MVIQLPADLVVPATALLLRSSSVSALVVCAARRRRIDFRDDYLASGAGEALTRAQLLHAPPEIDDGGEQLAPTPAGRVEVGARGSDRFPVPGQTAHQVRFDVACVDAVQQLDRRVVHVIEGQQFAVQRQLDGRTGRHRPVGVERLSDALLQHLLAVEQRVVGELELGYEHFQSIGERGR